MSLPIILQIYENDSLFEVKQFLQDQIVIGSGEQEVSLPNDPSIVPIHALIEKRGNKYFLCDLGSASGTFKNGNKILDEEIDSADEIKIGKYKLLFYIGVPKPKIKPQTVNVKIPDESAKPIPEGGISDITSTTSTSTSPISEITVQEEIPDKELNQKKFQEKIPDQTIIPKSVKAQVNNNIKVKGTYAPPDIDNIYQTIKPGKGSNVEILILWENRIISNHHYEEPAVVSLGNRKGNSIVVPSLKFNNFPILIRKNNQSLVYFGFDQNCEVINEENKKFTFDQLKRNNLISATDKFYYYNLKQGELIHISSPNSNISVVVRFVPRISKPGLAPSMEFTAGELTALTVALVFISLIYLYMYVYAPVEIDKNKKEEDIRFARFIYENVPKTPKPEPKKVRLQDLPDVPKKAKKPPVKTVVKKEEPKKKDVKKAPKSKVVKVTAKSPAKKNAGKAKAVRPAKNNNKKDVVTSSVDKGRQFKTGKSEGGSNAASKKKDVSKMGLFSAFGGKGTRNELNKAYSGSGDVIGLADQATGKSGFSKDVTDGDKIGSDFKNIGKTGQGTATVGISRGIKTKGRGGGLSNYGRGSGGGGIGEKQSASIVLADSGEEQFSGVIDKEAVKRVVQAGLRQLQFCYERELNVNPNLFGKVVAIWTIAKHGIVSSAKVKQTTLRNRQVERCILRRIRSWRFPEPAEGRIAEVIFPFMFTKAK